QGGRPGAARGGAEPGRGASLHQGASVKVAVCDYGAGNVRSVLAAFARLGADAALARGPADVAAAELAVLPGVGSAGSAMAARHGSFLGVQFHPEKSGAAGARFLESCLFHA